MKSLIDEYTNNPRLEKIIISNSNDESSLILKDSDLAKIITEKQRPDIGVTIVKQDPKDIA